MAEEDYLDDEATGRGRGCAINLMNVVTVLLILGSVAIAAALIVLLLAPGDLVPSILGRGEAPPTPTTAAVAEAPTVAPQPSDAPTDTPTSELTVLLPPTSTPIPQQASPTPVPINTLRPTTEPSITPTFPPPTPTRTPTPTPTDTPTPGPSPTATNTRSPFPFTKDTVSPQYLQNFANQAGCNWLGIAGEVIDINGNPVPYGEYRVHIWESGIDARVIVGDAPAYGPSGYEQYLFDAPRVQDQNIQLETANGTAVSQVYRVQTRASCNQNLLFFVFQQNH